MKMGLGLLGAAFFIGNIAPVPIFGASLEDAYGKLSDASRSLGLRLAQQEPGRAAPDVIDPEFEAFTVSVTIVDKEGYFIYGLDAQPFDRKYFKVYENGVEQDILRFEYSQDAPVTVAFLFEWRSLLRQLAMVSPWQSRMAYEHFLILRQLYRSAEAFVTLLDHPEDMVGIVAYNDYKATDCSKEADPKEREECEKEDLRRWKWQVVTDFTKNKDAALRGLERLGTMGIPYSHRPNLFDALARVLETLESYPGRKAIVVVGTGMDDFSSNFRDQVVRKAARGLTPIYTISTAHFWKTWLEFYFRNWDPMGNVVQEIPAPSDFDMGNGALTELSQKTAGRHFQVRGLEEVPGFYQQVFSILRNQFLLTYIPKNRAKDGRLHKIEVRLVELDGQGGAVPDKNGRPKPLEIPDYRDKKGKKKLKYKIHATEGRQAPKE